MSARFINYLLLLTVFVLCSRTALAQEESYPHVYRAWFEAGALFSQETELDSFPGVGSSKLTLNPGFRVGVGTDYTFTPYLSVGWEVAVLSSSVDRAAALDEMDATITQVPFLVTLSLRHDFQTGFTPFIGIGAGVSPTAIDVSEARSGATNVEGSDYDFVLALQIGGGLKYEFDNGLALGVSYKYLWSTDADWELENESGGTNQDLGLDGIQSHAVLAFVSYRF